MRKMNKDPFSDVYKNKQISGISILKIGKNVKPVQFFERFDIEHVSKNRKYAPKYEEDEPIIQLVISSQINKLQGFKLKVKCTKCQFVQKPFTNVKNCR